MSPFPLKIPNYYTLDLSGDRKRGAEQEVAMKLVSEWVTVSHFALAHAQSCSNQALFQNTGVSQQQVASREITIYVN